MVYTIEARRLGEEKKGATTSNQGGTVYQTDTLTKLRRFLILGTEKGSFYTPAQEMTHAASKMLSDTFDELGTEAIDEIVAISEAGRAPKNDPALFALACAAAYEHDNKETQGVIRSAALVALPRVARTGTHLFTFVGFVNEMRGWGRSLANGVARWYLSKPSFTVAQQATKYAQRNGWSHADVLRKAHPQTSNESLNAVFKYIVDGDIPALGDAAGRYLRAVAAVKAASTVDQVVYLIKEFHLPREVIPTQWLNEPSIWRALFPSMGLTALLRNLGNLSKHGILVMGGDETAQTVTRLTSEAQLRKARVHPISILMALFTYRSGHGVRGNSKWTPVQAVVDALEGAFYLSFGNVEPYNKSTLIALDISGSMTFPDDLCDVPGLSPRVASALMAMIVARTEPSYAVLGFSHTLVELPIGKYDSLTEVVRKISNLDFGGTDCTLPIKFAKAHKLPIGAFQVYTDSEHGNINSVDRAMKQFRASVRPDAKMAVQQMVYNPWGLMPTCDYALNVVGLDSASPTIVSEYMADRL